jgi:hypothetical protein
MLASVAPEPLQANEGIPPITNYAANPTQERTSHPIHTHPSGEERMLDSEERSLSQPMFIVIVAAEVCSLQKEYPQVRRGSDPESTQPTHYVHSVWKPEC